MLALLVAAMQSASPPKANIFGVRLGAFLVRFPGTVKVGQEKGTLSIIDPANSPSRILFWLPHTTITVRDTARLKAGALAYFGKSGNWGPNVFERDGLRYALWTRSRGDIYDAYGIIEKGRDRLMFALTSRNRKVKTGPFNEVERILLKVRPAPSSLPKSKG